MEFTESAEDRQDADVASSLTTLLTKFEAGSAAQFCLQQGILLAFSADIEPPAENLVDSSPNGELGRWFNSRQTSEGLRIDDALRTVSGLYQEHSNWGPL